MYLLRTGTSHEVEALAAFERDTFRRAHDIALGDRGWENPRRLFRFGADGFAILLGADSFMRAPARLVFLHAPSAVAP